MTVTTIQLCSLYQCTIQPVYHSAGTTFSQYTIQLVYHSVGIPFSRYFQWVLIIKTGIACGVSHTNWQ